MTQPSEGQRRQELLFALEEFKNRLSRYGSSGYITVGEIEYLVTILMKGL